MNAISVHVLARLRTIRLVLIWAVVLAAANEISDPIEQWFYIVNAEEMRIRMRVLTDSPDKLAENYFDLVEFLFDWKPDTSDLKDAKKLVNPDARILCSLTLLADGIREHRNNPNTKPLAIDFRKRLTDILGGDVRSSILSRERALKLLATTYLYEQCQRTKDESLAEIEVITVPYLNDDDARVRKQAVSILMRIGIQSEEREPVIKTLLNDKLNRIANVDRDLADFIQYELAHDAVRIRHFMIDEEIYLKLRHMSDDELLKIIRTQQERPESSFALEIITESWERTTRNYVELLQAAQEGIATRKVLRALARPIPVSATELEKKNADRLVEYLHTQLAAIDSKCDRNVWQALLDLLTARKVPDAYENIRTENLYALENLLDLFKELLLESSCREEQAWLVGHLSMSLKSDDDIWKTIRPLVSELRQTLRPESEHDARLIMEIDDLSDSGLIK